MHMTMLITFRMNGYVPNFFMNWVTKKGSSAPIIVEEYIVDGKIPNLIPKII